MRKSRAFTIVELLISVALIGLIIVYLYSVSGNLQKSNQFYDAKQQKEDAENRIKELFFRDIIEIASNEINITEGFDKEYSILNFKTHNSLHGLANPYVMYAVSREDSTLIRSESMVDFNFSDENFFNKTKSIEIVKDVEKFLVSSDEKNKKKFLFFLQKSGESPIYFEVLRIADYSRTSSSTSEEKTSKSSASDATTAGGDTPPAMPEGTVGSSANSSKPRLTTPPLPGIPNPQF